MQITYGSGHRRREIGPIGLALALAVAVALVGMIAYGMATEPERAERILKERGYTDVTVLPAREFQRACGRHRGVAPRFTATGPDGMPATGIVCTSILFPGVERSYD